MIQTIQHNWLNELKQELRETDHVRIVSPFITDNLVRLFLESFTGNQIQVITRFNLNDFRSGVSSISALERLLNAGARIKGVQGLHSKLYLFDQKSVIITSANFTNGGFFQNKEFGIKSYNQETISSSEIYFKELWDIDRTVLTQELLEEWKPIVKRTLIARLNEESLPDYGKSYQEKIIGSGKRHFIKFFGKGDHRKPLSQTVRNEITGSCSHFAMSFSRTKRDARPIRYGDGDIVYMARMTEYPDDYAIFGKAIAIAHDRKRDVANNQDINHISWLADWPILVRVHSPVYIDSTLKNCPKLFDLIDNLDFDSFSSTQRKFKMGIRNINPKGTLMQKGDVILSDLGALWVEERFQEAVQKHGKVPKTFYSRFYQGRPL